MSTLTKIKGVMKKPLNAVERTNQKTGKPFKLYSFILQPLDGSSDVFVNSYKPYDKSLMGKTLEVTGEAYGDNTINIKEKIVVLDDEATAIVSPKAEAPVKERKTVTKVSSGSNTNVDWAAKDRAMAAGGIMHDAAAIVAATITPEAETNDVIERVKSVAVGLVAVKRAVEEELK